jgi:hypothetical protein
MPSRNKASKAANARNRNFKNNTFKADSSRVTRNSNILSERFRDIIRRGKEAAHAFKNKRLKKMVNDLATHGVTSTNINISDQVILELQQFVTSYKVGKSFSDRSRMNIPLDHLSKILLTTLFSPPNLSKLIRAYLQGKSFLASADCCGALNETTYGEVHRDMSIEVGPAVAICLVVSANRRKITTLFKKGILCARLLV